MPQLFDMTLEEIDEWSMQEMLATDHSLNAILRGQLVVEQILETLISTKLANPNAFSFGLVTGITL